METEIVPDGNLLKVKEVKTRKHNVRLFRKMLESGGEDRQFLAYCKQRLLKSQSWNGSQEVMRIPTEHLSPHPLHPRKLILEKETRNLAHAMIYHGINEPLAVIPHPHKPEEYYILDGKRRWLAATTGKIALLPCVVLKAATDEEVLTFFAVNDDQNMPYNIIEKGMLYLALRHTLEMSQREMAEYIRIAQSTVSRAEKAASCLHPEIIDDYLKGDPLLSMHALRLITVSNQKKQIEFYRQAKKEHWTPRILKQKVDTYLQRREDQQSLRIRGNVFKAIIQPCSPIWTPQQFKADVAKFCCDLFDKHKVSKEEQQEFYRQMAAHVKQL